MSRQHIELGKKGEDAAVEFLKKSGYRIIERNYKNKLGEIDIVAKDSGSVCFIEVKTRTSLAFGLPEEAITKAKQRKLNNVALSYLKQYNLGAQPARFDIVSVMMHTQKNPEVTVIKDAFSVS